MCISKAVPDSSLTSLAVSAHQMMLSSVSLCTKDVVWVHTRIQLQSRTLKQSLPSPGPSVAQLQRSSLKCCCEMCLSSDLP